MTLGTLALTFTVLFAQDYAADPTATAPDFSAVRALFAAASYEEALAELAGMDEVADFVQVEQYRALCLLGLGRMDEAERSLERMVMERPLYQIEGSEVSPRLVTMFRNVRRRLLPEAARDLYATATTSFDDERYDDAKAEFEVLLGMLDDDSLLAQSDTFIDMQRLAHGFLTLATVEVDAAMAAQARAAEEARRAAEAVAEPVVPAQPVIYAGTDAGVVPPVEIDRRMPRWNPPSHLAFNAEYSGLLEIIIDEKGRVERASLLRSVAAFYDRQLLDAATTWRFEPATRNGTPVKFRKTLEIVGSRR